MSSFEPLPVATSNQGFRHEPLGPGAGFESLRDKGLREQSERDEVERGAVIQEAVERGRAEGRAQTEAELAGPLSAALASLVDLERSYLERNREGVIDLAIAISERLLRRTLSEDAEALNSFLEHALASAVEAADANAVLEVRLSPTDLDACQRLGVGAGHRGLQLVADDTLERGDVYIEAGTTEVDARIWRLLEQVRGTLLPAVEDAASPASSGESAAPARNEEAP